MQYITKHIHTLLLLLIGLSSCHREDVVTPTPGPLDLGDGIFLALNLPQDLSTRYVSSAIEEKAITEMCVFYFDHTTQKFTGYADLGTPLKTVSDVRYYELKNYELGKTVDMVFIANPGANKTSFSPDDSWKTKTYTDVLGEFLSLTNADNGSIWATNNTSDGSQQYIPMCARLNNVEIPATWSKGTFYVKENDTPSTTVSTYRLIRMVARVEIDNKLDDISQGREKLVIDDIWLVNGHKTGYMGYTPTLATYNSTEKRVETPTLLSLGNVDSGDSRKMQPVTLGSTGATYQKLVFYIFEAAVANTDKKSQSNCHIMLEGKINGAGDKVKYMLHFPAINDADVTVNTTAPGPVLRNHSYNYTIKGVKNGDDIELPFTVSVVTDWTEANATVNL